jgi:all-trans-retinol 13,14-reductase
MIVGQKYVSNEIDSVYDAIVIGSGLGGLTTAALMAKAGKKVLVLERHYTAGGFTHSFKRRGYEWDVGVHYVGEVHNPNSPLRRTFDFITDSQLEWAKMDAVYDKIIIKDEQYNFVAGATNFREELLKSFPNGRKQIDAYLHHIRAASRSLPAHFGPRFLPGALQSTIGPMVGRLSDKYFHRTTQAVMADFITDPKLASVLCGQWGDYGLPPGQSSFAMHAVVAQHYMGGGNFPVGGASQIARHIEPVIQHTGGAVAVNAEVEQIMVERHGSGHRAIGVRMANGDEILSKQVISAAGLYNTYGKLMPEAVGAQQRLSEKLGAFKPSVAHLGLYIGLNASVADLQLEQANMWIYRDHDHDKSLSQFLAKPTLAFPLNYISFPSSKDPAWDTHYPGKSTIDVISIAPFDWFRKWADQPWKNRGADYDAFKAQLSERLLADVYKHVPTARGKVDYFELSTPLSTAHFNNYAHGQLYGMEHTPERFAQSWVKPSTPIKGLYLTGQDILFCGVASAMMSGVMTATSALGVAATKLIPELVSPRARWLTQVLDKLPIVGNSASTARTACDKLAEPDPVQRAFVGRCVEVTDVTPDVKALRFVDDSGAALAYKPGQFVTLQLDISGKQVFRSYTMSSTPTQTAYFEVTVKRVDGGLVSNWLCDEVIVGARLHMTGPHGKFSCAPKPRKPLLMLSAGSGVTPMLSMSRWIRDSALDVDVVYFHCARTEADLMFADEVAQMEQTYSRFVQHISLTRAPKPMGRRRPFANAPGRQLGLTGYLDLAMLQAVAPDYKQREIYICGPSGFMADTKAMIQASGFDMRHHHEESFGIAGNIKASGGSVFFAKSGTEVACSGTQSILDIAQQAGVKIASACRTGDCGECKVKKLEGDAPMANTDGLDPNELEDGTVLSCVAFVNGKVTVDA